MSMRAIINLRTQRIEQKKKEKIAYEAIINSCIQQCYCAQCKKHIFKFEKIQNKGFCNKCKDKIEIEKRCVVCFEKINTQHYIFGDACDNHTRNLQQGGNTHGYKESTTTDFWHDNQNDNVTKVYEC